jgi:hypothetical protein
MKDPKAEQCRRNADRARRVANGACENSVREIFLRLADGYDAIAEHLEQVAEWPRDQRESDLTLDTERTSLGRSGRFPCRKNACA